MTRIINVIPSYRPVGGIAKVLDYAVHAVRLGYEVHFCSVGNQDYSALFEKPYFKEYAEGAVEIHSFSEIEPKQDDILFFSLPSNFRAIYDKYSVVNLPMERVIHLVQNVRHTNIAFDQGFATLLLPIPITRISITPSVCTEISSFITNSDAHHYIRHGFDFSFFNTSPAKREGPLKCSFNTFKGDFGFKVECKNIGIELEYKYNKSGDSWESIKETIGWSDIFIGTPLVEEGLYLPALEAMAAGNLVIIPNAFGNMLYTEYEKNSIYVNHENTENYVAAIDRVANMPEQILMQFQQNSIDMAETLSYGAEMELFNNILRGL